MNSPGDTILVFALMFGVVWGVLMARFLRSLVPTKLRSVAVIRHCFPAIGMIVSAHAMWMNAAKLAEATWPRAWRFFFVMATALLGTWVALSFGRWRNLPVSFNAKGLLFLLPRTAREAFWRDWLDERAEMIAAGHSSRYIRFILCWKIAWEVAARCSSFLKLLGVSLPRLWEALIALHLLTRT